MQRLHQCRVWFHDRGYGAQWEVFADQIQPVARRMPWMTVGGNHERDWPDSGDRYGNVMDSGGSPYVCQYSIATGAAAVGAGAGIPV